MKFSAMLSLSGLLLATSSAYAANIQYTKINGGMDADLAIDRYGEAEYTNCIYVSSVTTPDSFSALSDSVVANSGNSSDPSCGFMVASTDANLSAVSQSGFSIDGTVNTNIWNVYTSDDPLFPSDAVASGSLYRSVFFTLEETTELLLDMAWGDCINCVGDVSLESSFYLQQGVYGSPLTAIDVQSFSADALNGAGAFTNSYTLGPGDYRILLRIDAAAVGGSGTQGEFGSSIGITVVPLPAAVWLFLSALGIAGLRGRRV